MLHIIFRIPFILFSGMDTGLGEGVVDVVVVVVVVDDVVVVVSVINEVVVGVGVATVVIGDELVSEVCVEAEVEVSACKTEVVVDTVKISIKFGVVIGTVLLISGWVSCDELILVVLDVLVKEDSSYVVVIDVNSDVVRRGVDVVWVESWKVVELADEVSVVSIGSIGIEYWEGVVEIISVELVSVVVVSVVVVSVVVVSVEVVSVVVVSVVVVSVEVVSVVSVVISVVWPLVVAASDKYWVLEILEAVCALASFTLVKRVEVLFWIMRILGVAVFLRGTYLESTVLIRVIKVTANKIFNICLIFSENCV